MGLFSRFFGSSSTDENPYNQKGKNQQPEVVLPKGSFIHTDEQYLKDLADKAPKDYLDPVKKEIMTTPFLVISEESNFDLDDKFTSPTPAKLFKVNYDKDTVDKFSLKEGGIDPFHTKSVAIIVSVKENKELKEKIQEYIRQDTDISPSKNPKA